MRPGIKAAAVVSAVVVGGIQLVPYGRDHARLATIAEAPWPDAPTRRLAEAACGDCHSGRTDWPWYSNVAPASWLVQRDVDAGRDEWRFDAWDGDGDDAADAIEDGAMPPRRYTLVHPEARLSTEEKERLIDAFEAMDDEPAARG